MRDSRVTIFTGAPVTISTATTTNGATIDLLTNVYGDFKEGVGVGYGIGVELSFTSITGVNNNVNVFWQVSDDDATWETDAQILEGELSTLLGTGTKIMVPTRFRTNRRYCRIVVVTTTMTASSFILNAWLSDGTPEHTYGQSYMRK